VALGDKVAAGHELRVSDAEREAAAAELQEHYASGRLDSDELDQRLSAALAARTRGDLSALFTDLPSDGQAGPGPVSAGSGRSFGPRTGDWGRWTPPGGNAGDRTRGSSWAGSAGRAAAQFAAASLVVWALFIVGLLGVFGLGAGRPLGIVFLLAAFLVRRLLSFFFGRRRGGRGPRGRGPRRRC
jgi:Domain of unknown function (DUF1707)